MGAGLLGLGLCLLWIARRGRHPLLIATRTELAAEVDGVAFRQGGQEYAARRIE